ncbi:uncharacterized protein LOC132201081 isoform X2 [Neocloeon triangulifer]|uniref:uncharacterized protein LOC132201081 isoform X2 n=1 Tax=Neocloeon triangulifer TaxID=2078957 RepID=UPI00286EE616|nr:uncharacterized protein LOC132201081 isoform X2 [Neocloeon triangulifer]
MLAQLCNPLMVRRFKLHPSAPEGRNKTQWRHSWSSLAVENNHNADGGLLERRSQQDSDSESDEENRRQGPDLLQECWNVRREDECLSEPGTSEPLYDSIASLAMGQRASSTSSLHAPAHRPRGPALPPSNKVSLTWALLRKPNHDLFEKSAPKKQVVEPLLLQTGRHQEQQKQTQKTSRNYQTSSQSTSSRSQSSRNSRSSSSSMRNFGYDIHDVDEFLSKASLQSPANIPVVLATPCVLYQSGTRRSKSGRGTWRQSEISLPLGMVVNAVFRNHTWLFVHTPHGEAGYVRYRSCLPLGILPSPVNSVPGTPAPGAWDTHTDAFLPPPLPQVGMSGKVRRGAASVCERLPKNKTDMEKLRDTVSECGAGRSRHRHRRAQKPEAAVDRLFLAAQRSESESAKHRRPRSSVETLLKDAELSSRRFRAGSANLDSVSVKDSVSQVGVRCPKPKYSSKKMDKLEDYQFRIEQNLNQLKPNHRTIALQTDFEYDDSLVKETVSEVGRFKRKEVSKSRAVSECGAKCRQSSRAPSSAALSEVQMKTETLLLIRSNYNSRGRNTLSVSKGDVVVLVSSRLKDWFWVRRTDGCEGFIPAVVAGHGFL